MILYGGCVQYKIVCAAELYAASRLQFNRVSKISFLIVMRSTFKASLVYTNFVPCNRACSSITSSLFCDAR